MEKHVPNLLAALWGFCFFLVVVGLSKLVRPGRGAVLAKNPDDPDYDSPDKPAIRLSPGYQVLLAVTAVLFFGLLLLYPAAATFRQWLADGRGAEALVLVGLFLGTLAVALAYAWMKGDLSSHFGAWAQRLIKDKEDHSHGHSRKRTS